MNVLSNEKQAAILSSESREASRRCWAISARACAAAARSRSPTQRRNLAKKAAKKRWEDTETG